MGVPFATGSHHLSDWLQNSRRLENKDEPEEAEAVQRSGGALRCDQVHRLEPGQDVHAEAKQPRDNSSTSKSAVTIPSRYLPYN